MPAAKLVSEVIAVTNFVVTVALYIRVIQRRQEVSVALAWMAFMLVPIAGPIGYLLFGENRLQRARTERVAEMELYLRLWAADLKARWEDRGLQGLSRSAQMARLGEALTSLPPLPGNSLELYEDALTALRALITDIDAAERTCHLLFYIWQPGGVVDDVAEAVCRAADRGVECRVLVDAIGSKAFLASSQCAEMRVRGVTVVAALPVRVYRVRLHRMDVRNHRKIGVIDGAIAWTGSMNVVDPRYFKQGEGVGEWVDAAVRIRGPAVEALGAVFAADWCFEEANPRPERIEELGIRALETSGKTIAQVIPSGPSYQPHTIHDLLIESFYNASEELIISTPYFVPDTAIVRALASAARRGVRVVIILPRDNDSKLVQFASTAHFDTLIEAGVHVMKYGEGLLHTKAISVDRDFCIFGTVNLDMRSFWINFEVSVFVYNGEFPHQLYRLLRRYAEQSQPFDYVEWQERPLYRRALENVARLASPLL